MSVRRSLAPLLAATVAAGSTGCIKRVPEVVPLPIPRSGVEILALPVASPVHLVVAQSETAIVSLWMERNGAVQFSRFDGAAWAAPVLVAAARGEIRRLAVFPRHDDSVLACWFDAESGISARSADAGATWSDPVRLRSDIAPGSVPASIVDVGLDSPAVVWIAGNYGPIVQPEVVVAYPGIANNTTIGSESQDLRADPKEGISAAAWRNHVFIGFVRKRSDGTTLEVVDVDGSGMRSALRRSRLMQPSFGRIRPAVAAAPHSSPGGFVVAFAALARRRDSSVFLGAGTTPAIFLSGWENEPLPCNRAPRDLRLHLSNDEWLLGFVEDDALMLRRSSRGASVLGVPTPGADPDSLQLLWLGALDGTPYFLWKSDRSPSPVFARLK